MNHTVLKIIFFQIPFRKANQSIFIWTVMFSLLVSCDYFSQNSYAVEKSNALEYNDYLVKQIDTVSFKFIEFLDAYNQSYSVSVLDEIRLEMIGSANYALEQLRNVKPYQEETDFIGASKEVIHYYKEIAEQKLLAAVEILRKEESGEIVEEDYETAFELLYEAEVKEFEVLLRFDKVQSEFIATYHQLEQR